jgi:hypothetical protein
MLFLASDTQQISVFLRGKQQLILQRHFARLRGSTQIRTPSFPIYGIIHCRIEMCLLSEVLGILRQPVIAQ